MRKMFVTVLIFTLFISAAAFAVKSGKGGGGKASSGEMNVEVREAQVKSSPNYLATSAGKVTYGMKVNVIGEQGSWYQINSPAGWLPKTALTKHKVALNPDQKYAATSARHDEVALAGKGFNPQVEEQYKKDNADLARAYTQVDKIEQINISDAELKAFQTAGKLNTR